MEDYKDCTIDNLYNEEMAEFIDTYMRYYNE